MLFFYVLILILILIFFLNISPFNTSRKEASKQDPHARFTLSPGSQKPITQLEAIRLQLRVEHYKISEISQRIKLENKDWISKSKDKDINSKSIITIEMKREEGSGSLTLLLEQRGGEIEIWCEYWVVNQTCMPLEYRPIGVPLLDDNDSMLMDKGSRRVSESSESRVSVNSDHVKDGSLSFQTSNSRRGVVSRKDSMLESLSPNMRQSGKKKFESSTKEVDSTESSDSIFSGFSRMLPGKDKKRQSSTGPSIINSSSLQVVEEETDEDDHKQDENFNGIISMFSLGISRSSRSSIHSSNSELSEQIAEFPIESISSERVSTQQIDDASLHVYSHDVPKNDDGVDSITRKYSSDSQILDFDHFDGIESRLLSFSGLALSHKLEIRTNNSQVFINEKYFHSIHSFIHPFHPSIHSFLYNLF